ncbi:hypothetical protein BDV33DRAFT_232443 [Aspergillus novoparasiticus]|uniref:FAD-dependent pyridine nucleotide-disulfide oxidoreductase n=1 Tax=Aspergillus novoparasiticus TaxID=986946 RepID=A0A5N6ENE4_9EURO|nr:hypothetical protein BDV33DRAFT_232443 [Aspergillus novoparasiticus]
MATTAQYDAIIIGSGQGGTPLAKALAGANKKTALIEKEHIGGCCINEGCTPTKTMIASGRVAHLIRRGPDYGIHVPYQIGPKNEFTVSMNKIRQRKRDIVSSFRSGSEKGLEAAGVDILRGEATFIDAHSLNVILPDGSHKALRGDKFVVNVGCRPAPPRLDGLESIGKDRVLDSTSIQELGELPEHLVVIGGGYVGVEFGQLFARLGSKVTIVHRGAQLLSREDKEVAAEVLDILRDEKLTIYLEARATSLASAPAETFSLSIATKGGNEIATNVTHLLFATGRVPNTDRLNLGAAGVEVDVKGYIKCNEFLETSVPSIYALGDVKGPPAFTHISYDDFRILKGSLFSDSRAHSGPSVKDRLVPYVVYTDPQLGHVGLHEGEARERYPRMKILTATMPMSYVARALETDEPRGMMKAVVNADDGQILGFTCLGTEGGELMSIVEVAMIAKLPYWKLQDAVFAHPAFAESLNNLWQFLK